MAFSVATPSRALSTSGPDRHRPFPRPLGGDNGTVAVPSREASAIGEGAPERPGQIVPLDTAAGRVLTGNAPSVLDLSTYPHRVALPRPTFAAHYVRRWVSMFGVVCGYAPPADADTPWTMNRRADESSAPLGGIPFGRRFLVQTFRQQFDQRIQADYVPRAKIQIGVAPRRQLEGAGPIMARPYFARLTRLAPQQSYGQQTPVLTAAGSFASGLSRFSVMA